MNEQKSFLTFTDRPSDAALVERVWRAQSNGGGTFHSIAESNLELVITRLPGTTRVTLRGPVTKPSAIAWLAVRFRLGTYLPGLTRSLRQLTGQTPRALLRGQEQLSFL